MIHKTPEGEFGPRILQSMYTHSSIFVRTSKSGKVTKEILQEWATNIFFKAPNTKNSVLLLDSFTLHQDRPNLDKKKPKNFKYELKWIPPGTTKKCQPLDREPNRTMKNIIRHMSEAFMIEDDRITERSKLSCRDSIDKLQVLLLNQIDSPRFRSWIAHSWKSCGYTDKNIEYTSPSEFCFNMDVYRTRCDLCNNLAFIRCGWCKYYFCEYHFFFRVEMHFCSRYKQ